MRSAQVSLPVKMAIQKITAVIAVQAEQVEGLAFPDGFEAGDGGVLTAVPYRAQLRPAAGDLNAGERPDEIPAHVTAAMGHGVHFGPAGLAGVPAGGANLHEGLDGAGGLGRTDLFRGGHFEGLEHPVDTRGADFLELGARFQRAIQVP